MSGEVTPEEIAQQYSAMGSSADLISRLAGETSPYNDTARVLQANVDHLSQMRAKDYWTDEDFTAVDAAITAGTARIAEVEADGVERPTYETADAARAAVKGWIERLLNQITDKYPRHEIDSWATKNEAARAVKAGIARTYQTALIQAEADALNATLADQADLIITKADQFTAIISLTSGMRQQVGAALDAASTPEQYEAIVNAALVSASTAAAQYGLSVG